MSFVKVDVLKAVLFWKACMKFCQYYYNFDPIGIKFGTGDFHIMYSSVRGFHENRRSERRILLRPVIEYVRTAHIYGPNFHFMP